MAQRAKPGGETTIRIVCYSVHGFEEPYLRGANARGHQVTELKTRLDATTVELAAGADAASLFVNDDGSAPILDRIAALGVRHLALRSAGYNHVDLRRAATLGLRVANVPDYSPHAVAEHTVCLMLALNRRLIRADRRVHDLNFSLDGLVGFDMHGRTAGIVGVGKIGAEVARILHGFGCRLLGLDPAPSPALTSETGIRYVELETLCREADIVTLHAPLTPETRRMIGARALGWMRRGAMLINTSRGGLVDTRAVIAALKTGHLGYVGLDVYEEEQELFFQDHSDVVLQDDVIARLLTFPNVLITSHQAFLTTEALTAIAEATFRSIDCWADGRASPTELVPDR